MHVQHEGAIEQRDSQTSSAYLAEPVLLQLRSIASLSPSDPEVIGDPRHRRYRYWAGEQVLTEGEEGFRPQFVIQGWAFRYRITTGGRRQIFGVLLPGDRLGFDTGPALASIVALTVLQTVDARAALEAARNSSPTLARALLAQTRNEEALLLNHAVRLGRLSAIERATDFLLETHRRLETVRLADRERFPLPLTQEMLADVLGLSVVHVNRVLQQLRRKGFANVRAGSVDLRNPEVLAAL